MSCAKSEPASDLLYNINIHLNVTYEYTVKNSDNFIIISLYSIFSPKRMNCNCKAKIQAYGCDTENMHCTLYIYTVM